MKQFALLALLPTILITSAMAAETKAAATPAERQKFRQERADYLKKNPAEHQRLLAKRQKHQQTMQELMAKLRETKDPAQQKLLMQKMEDAMKANTPADMMPIAIDSKRSATKRPPAAPASAK